MQYGSCLNILFLGRREYYSWRERTTALNFESDGGQSRATFCWRQSKHTCDDTYIGERLPRSISEELGEKAQPFAFNGSFGYCMSFGGLDNEEKKVRSIFDGNSGHSLSERTRVPLLPEVLLNI